MWSGEYIRFGAKQSTNELPSLLNVTAGRHDFFIARFRFCQLDSPLSMLVGAMSINSILLVPASQGFVPTKRVPPLVAFCRRTPMSEIRNDKKEKLFFLNLKQFTFNQNMIDFSYIPKTIETHIYRIRQKIEKDGGPKNFIVNDLGGYKLIS